jgi:LysM repeat protein
MVHRNPARLFAPLALGLALVGVVVIIAASRPSPSDSPSPASGTTATTQRTTPDRPRRRVYVVKAGDTLTAIADKAGVSLATLQELNPRVDPQALQTGQRLKLSP